jgi:hypothetical protein
MMKDAANGWLSNCFFFLPNKVEGQSQVYFPLPPAKENFYQFLTN